MTITTVRKVAIYTQPKQTKLARKYRKKKRRRNGGVFFTKSRILRRERVGTTVVDNNPTNKITYTKISSANKDENDRITNMRKSCRGRG